MGVGQSRELLGKISDDRVFISTNSNELSILLSLLNEQQKEGEKESEEGFSSETEENISGDDNALEKQREDTEKEVSQLSVVPLSTIDAETLTGGTCETDEPTGRILGIHIANHYMGDDALHTGVLNALTADQTLQSLYVAYNAFSARGVSAITNALLRPSSSPHPRLRLLNLGGNHAGPEGCHAVAKLLEANPPIRELSLFHNGLYDRDVQPILNALVSNTKLRVLNFDLNYLTGKFLRMLLKLLQHNLTIAAVLYDGPYDPKTLEPIVAEHDTAGEDPSADPSAAEARASLRRQLLCADLAGRPPFPKDLADEVEAILAPRRAAYLAELAAEVAGGGDGDEARGDGEEEDARSGGCRSLAQDVEPDGQSAGMALEGVSGNGEEGLATKEEEGGKGDEEDEEKSDIYGMNDEEEEEGEGEEEYGSSDTNHSSAQLASNDVMFPPLSGNGARKASRASMQTGATSAVLSGRPRESTQALSVSALNSRAIDEAAKWRSKMSNKRKELKNGFDRMRISTVGSAVPGTRSSCEPVGETARRLRACWCDPRDVAAPYSGMLHYHCKHEPTGGDLGEMGTDGRPLKGVKVRSKRKQVRRNTLQQHVFLPIVEERKRTQYTGCKETSHKCESIGFYGRPKTDKSSVYFFSSEHPMHAPSLIMDSQY